VDRFDGQMFRLHGKVIELVDNGTDGVLFAKQQNWIPYKYLENIAREGLLADF